MMYLPHQRHSSIMRDRESLNQKEPWPFSFALRPFCSAKPAVVGRYLHGTTLGMWNWFTPNPDAPLVLAWLACRTYPEEFADYPLEDTIRDYYKQWYGYDVTDEELAEMLRY